MAQCCQRSSPPKKLSVVGVTHLLATVLLVLDGRHSKKALCQGSIPTQAPSPSTLPLRCPLLHEVLPVLVLVWDHTPSNIEQPPYTSPACFDGLRILATIAHAPNKADIDP